MYFRFLSFDLFSNPIYYDIINKFSRQTNVSIGRISKKETRTSILYVRFSLDM